MARRVSYESRLIEGSINPRPEWRDPNEFDKVLVGNLKCVKQNPLAIGEGVWDIYLKEPDGDDYAPLVVAAYQKRGSVVHLFTNNPYRTTDGDLKHLLSDVRLTAPIISEGLYKDDIMKEITARLRDTFIGMIGGGAAGFTVGVGTIEILSKLFGVEIPISFGAVAAIPGGCLSAAYMGDIRKERRAAQQVIDNMPSHPDKYLHGPPAVHIIEKRITPVTPRTPRRIATRIFDV